MKCVMLTLSSISMLWDKSSHFLRLIATAHVYRIIPRDHGSLAVKSHRRNDLTCEYADNCDGYPAYWPVSPISSHFERDGKSSPLSRARAESVAWLPHLR